MKIALSRVKNGKAAGEYRIPAEVYKAGGNEMIRWLTDIYNLAYLMSKKKHRMSGSTV